MTEQMDELEIVRRTDERTVRVRAEYSETTDDWNVICTIDGMRGVFDARATTDPMADACDMICLALSHRETVRSLPTMREG